ncbi:MAG: arginase [Ignavibacteriales bacterium]|nr:MAG: arginase [Ignavibacteriales bacterium]
MKRPQSKIIDLIGFPMDLGAGRRGVDMGPSALRYALLDEKLENLGYTVNDLGDIDILNIEEQALENPKLKYLAEILKTCEILAREVESILDKDHFPLIIGGDHSMGLGTVAGISAHCRKKNKKLGVIWIDAHTDMNTDQTSPSGNIHGMPLAASLGIGHPSLTEFYGFSPKLKPEHCVVIGARSIDFEERENIRKAGIQVYTMTDVDKLGIHRVINRVLDLFDKNVDHIHVSFDCDSLDPSVAPGVGTPVPGGLSYREAHLLMESIADCGCMSSLEISEVNPILDTRNQSAEVMVELVASSMGMRIL